MGDTAEAGPNGIRKVKREHSVQREHSDQNVSEPIQTQSLKRKLTSGPRGCISGSDGGSRTKDFWAQERVGVSRGASCPCGLFAGTGGSCVCLRVAAVGQFWWDRPSES